MESNELIIQLGVTIISLEQKIVESSEAIVLEYLDKYHAAIKIIKMPFHRRPGLRRCYLKGFHINKYCCSFNRFRYSLPVGEVRRYSGYTKSPIYWRL